MNKIKLGLILAFVLLLLRPAPVSAQTGLILGVPVIGNLVGTYDAKYYEVSMSAGHHLLVVLDGADNGHYYGLCVKFGSLPTPSDYDAKGDLPNADQGVEITSPQVGTYYFLVRSTYLGGNYTILVEGSPEKIVPANAAIDVATNPTLSWHAASAVNSYEYCLTTTVTLSGTDCDTGWKSTGVSTSVPLSGLVNGDTYYWQVRANKTTALANLLQ